MSFLLVLGILLAVVLFVTAPLRRVAESSGGAAQIGHESAIAELEAAREAKLREITDAELDHQTGKLSDADYRALDDGLRAEAVEILNRLDALQHADPEPAGPARPDPA